MKNIQYALWYNRYWFTNGFRAGKRFGRFQSGYGTLDSEPSSAYKIGFELGKRIHHPSSP